MSLRHEMYKPSNSGYVTANYTLFKIWDDGIYFRIVPADREPEIRRDYRKRGINFECLRGNSVSTLEDYVEKQEVGHLRPEGESYEDRSVWRPISQFPKLPKIGKVKRAKSFYHNSRKTLWEGPCYWCEKTTTRVERCPEEGTFHRFCNSDCMEQYNNYIKRSKQRAWERMRSR